MPQGMFFYFLSRIWILEFINVFTIIWEVARKMHELSMATSLVEQITEIMKNEGATSLHSITLAIGKYSGVEKECFEFAFSIAAEGTHAEKAVLTIIQTDMKVKCRDCGAETVNEMPLAKCAKCSSLNVDVISGREFNIRSMEVE
jgi:hydrogenase nickel incorporation protein HypA/HybF